MNKHLILIILLVLSTNLFAQDKKFSIAANYPLPIDDNFIGKNYHGIADVEFKYRFIKLNPIKIGGSLNSGFLKTSNKTGTTAFNTRVITVQPKVFAELHLDAISRFHPSIGMGYSFLFFKTTNIKRYHDPYNPPINVSTNQHENGLNFNAGLSFDVTKSFFVQAQYDFINIGTKDVLDIKYNSHINLLKFGVGLKF